jgi:hypothetical protein
VIITKKCLPRRTFLRGLGVAVGLPLLEGMIPAFATASEAAAASPMRMTFIYVPNGILDLKHELTPVAEGSGFQMTPILQPLTPFREHLLVLSGLSHPEGRPQPGEAGGDHSRASVSFLTGVHAKQTEGADLQAGISLDQIAAKKLGEHTQLASLELALDSTETIGECETGYSCAYTNTLAWRTPTTPLPMENQPRAVFENLFGDSNSTDPKVRVARMKMQSSILDSLSEDVKGLVKGLGSSDSSKLTEYLDAIRDVERRIQLAEEQSSRNMPVVDRPMGGIPSTFGEHAKLMFDLQALAYQCDLTRVTTFMMGHETTTRAYPELGIPDSHHPLTHHGGDAEKMAKVLKINTFHTTMLAQFLDKLNSTPEGDGCLLDHCVVLYGSGLSDGNLHLHDNLTTLLVGGGSGKLKGNHHIHYPANTPMPRLYGTLLDVAGIPLDNLGTSAGKMEPLSIA